MGAAQRVDCHCDRAGGAGDHVGQGEEAVDHALEALHRDGHARGL